MPLPSRQDRNQGQFDKFLELRDKSLAAVTTTQNETPLAFPVRSMRSFRAILQHDAFTGFAAGTAFWTFTIRVATTAGGSYTTVGSYQTVSGAAAKVEIPLSGANIQANVPGAGFIRAVATITGAPGAIQYSCFLEELY